MKQDVNWYIFSDWFFKSEDRKNQFSYDALDKIYNYYIDLEDSCGEEIEFDPIAFCCEWTEYDNFKEIKKSYNIKTFKELEDNTTAYKLDNGHILVLNY